MKRRDLIRSPRAAGLEIREGGRHSLVYRDGVRVSAIPRHAEIKKVLVREIERQTGVKLLAGGS
ncbi:MAG: type II toxin-antitoxin system HicA family toxin [Pseudomonadota bacterium]